jgi:hypothetical protein
MLTLFGFAADRYLFNPQPYIGALENYRFPQLFPRLLAELIVQTEPPSDPSTAPGEIAKPANQIQYLGIDDYEIILSGLMPQEWIDAQMRGVVTQVFDILNLHPRQSGLRISLTEVKNQLAGPRSDEIALRMIDSWPACSLEWAAQVAILAATQGGLQGFPTCRPPDEFIGLIQPVVRGTLNALSASLPDQIDLLQVFRAVRSGQFRFDQIPPADATSNRVLLPASYQVLRWVLRLSPLITIWMLAVVALINVRTWRNLGTWWGAPCLIAGILSLVFSLILGIPVSTVVSRLLTQATQGVLTANLTQLILLAIQSVLQRYFLWVAIFAGILTLVGGALLAANRILRRPSSI